MSRRLKRVALASTSAALLAVVMASSSPASVTIGQVVPAAVACADNNNWAQTSVASGNGYTVPGTGTITSWSHSAGTGLGQTMTMKIWRQVAGLSYTAVGHDGPRTLTPSVVNIFPTSIPVKPGDILGLRSGMNVSACLSGITSGDSLLGGADDTVDGEQADFPSTFLRHLNITAVFNPSNTFTLGVITRHKKKGTATMTVKVPNAGELTGSGNGVSAAGAAVISKTVSAAGDTQLVIKAKGKKKRKLTETGSVTVAVSVTFTPTGGDPSTQSRKLKLKRKT
jgi:hypothetical protein